jgi:hypothetical protein
MFPPCFKASIANGIANKSNKERHGRDMIPTLGRVSL